MLSLLFARIRATRNLCKPNYRRRLLLETLEDRFAPATFTVLTAGDGPGNVEYTGPNTFTADTLRAALLVANNFAGDDVIQFDSSLAGATILVTHNDDLLPTAMGQTAYVVQKGAISIIGDADLGVTLHGDGQRRLFAVAPGASLTLQNMTLTGGMAQGGNGGDYNAGGGGGGGAGLGGAIYNNQGFVSLINCTLSGNTAQGGNGGSVQPVASLPGGGGGGGSAAFAGGNSGGDDSYYWGGGGAGMYGAGDPGGLAGDSAGGLDEFNKKAKANGTGQHGGGGGGGSVGNGVFWQVIHSGGPATQPNSLGFGGGGGGGAVEMGPSGNYGDAKGGAAGYGAGGGGAGYKGAAPGGAGGFGGGGGGGTGDNKAGPGGFGGGNGGNTIATQNQTGGAGGGGAGFGGAIFSNGGSLFIDKCTITGNSVFGGQGGVGQTDTSQDGGNGAGLGAALFVTGVYTISGDTDINENEIYEYDPAATPQLANKSTIYNDTDGDRFYVHLKGPGTATVTLSDPDNDGHGPIASIHLESTTRRSRLVVFVYATKGGSGDRHVDIGQIIGGDIGRIDARYSSITDGGIHMTGAIGKLIIDDVFADIFAGSISKATVLGDVADSVWELLGNATSTLQSLEMKGTLSHSVIRAVKIGTVKLNAVDDDGEFSAFAFRGSLKKLKVGSPKFTISKLTPEHGPITFGPLMVQAFE